MYIKIKISELKKKEITKPKASRRKEIIKIRAEINGIENRKTIKKINKNSSWFFQKINKSDKALARLTNTKREKAQIRNERGDVSTNFTEIKSIIRECHEQLYTNNSDN